MENHKDVSFFAILGFLEVSSNEEEFVVPRRT